MAADNLLRNKWLKVAPSTVFHNDEFHRFDKQAGIWRPRSNILIEKEVTAVLEKTPKLKVTGGLVGSVMRLAKSSCAVEPGLFDNKPNLLACRNGTLELSTRTLQPHSETNYLTSGVGYDYDPQAKAPGWERYLAYLKDALGVEVVNFLQEFGGLCVTTETKFEIAVWLWGSRGCGKGTFIEGLFAALQDRACLLGLASIERSQFALTRLPGKTLAFCTEQPNKAALASHILNAIISGEPIEVERKFHDTQEVRPVAKVLWSMNTLPQVADANDGIFRRTCVVEFPPLPEAQRDPQLREQIKSEGAAILNWLLDGLDAVMSRSQVLIPQQVKNANSAFQKANDLAALFLDDWGHTKTFRYSDFKEWCEENSHKCPSSNQMAGEWRRFSIQQINAKTREWGKKKVAP